MEVRLSSGKLQTVVRDSLYLFRKCHLRKTKNGIIGWYSQEPTWLDLVSLDGLSREDHVFALDPLRTQIKNFGVVLQALNPQGDFLDLDGNIRKLDFEENNDYFVVTNGIYVDEYEQQESVSVYFDENFNAYYKEKVFPPSRIYISVDFEENFDHTFTISFRSLSVVLAYGDVKLTKFSLAVERVNALFEKEFYSLLSESDRRLEEFEDLGIIPKVVITCSDGTVTFYAPLIPIFSDLKLSFFNTTSFEQSTLTFEYSRDLVVDLLKIYSSRRLPEAAKIVASPYFSNDVVTIYAQISDFLGFSFYSRYFVSLLSQDEYKILLS